MHTNQSTEMDQIITRSETGMDLRQDLSAQESVPHWLLRSVYGRHLLKTKLRQIRPDLQVSMIRDQPEYEQLLDSMIDELNLREWLEPRTVSERLKAIRQILRTTFEIEEERDCSNSQGV